MPRMVPFWEIQQKLDRLLSVGVDVDQIPPDWTIEMLMQIEEIKATEICGFCKKRVTGECKCLGE